MKPARARPPVDEKSFALAEHFLQDHPRTEDDTWHLAEVIQGEVEDWFGYREFVRARPTVSIAVIPTVPCPGWIEDPDSPGHCINCYEGPEAHRVVGRKQCTP